MATAQLTVKEIKEVQRDLRKIRAHYDIDQPSMAKRIGVSNQSYILAETYGVLRGKVYQRIITFLDKNSELI